MTLVKSIKTCKARKSYLFLFIYLNYLTPEILTMGLESTILANVKSKQHKLLFFSKQHE